MRFKWQEIYCEWQHSGYARTFRAKTIGGWLVKDWAFDYDLHEHTSDPAFHYPYISSAMIFVADPNHEWEIEEEE